MPARHHVGAAAPGQVTPTSDSARVEPGASEAEIRSDNLDSAKAATKAIDRAASLGIEIRRIDASTWLLRHPRGGDIGVVRGDDALVAAVDGFDAAHQDVRNLITRMRRQA